jgi:hypothetical protein
VITKCIKNAYELQTENQKRKLIRKILEKQQLGYKSQNHCIGQMKERKLCYENVGIEISIPTPVAHCTDKETRVVFKNSQLK